MAEINEGQPSTRVREMREDRLMTQAQLARKAEVALRTIHSVEKGMNCRMDTKRKILLALGMRLEDRSQVFPSRRDRAFMLASVDEMGTPGAAAPVNGSMPVV